MSHSPQDASKPISYRDAGVDIDAGNRLVDLIKPAAARTQRPEVMQGLGGFGALFALDWARYQHPVLVAGTDGVGTKVKLAFDAGQHDSIGIDLVAMCVNDLVVQGAEPLFFLDYFATAKLDTAKAAQVIEGIAAGCQQAGCALVGGETAEMPGMYAPGEYDLAGFCVGIVERDALIDGSRIQRGDVLLGLASSGFHSNGYSLLRRILEVEQTDLDAPCGDTSLRAALLEPTRIYVKSLLALRDHLPIHGLAHITGGGLVENLPRVMHDNLVAHIDTQSWTKPPVYDWLAATGRVDARELYRTFNAGIGMVVCVSADDAPQAVKILQSHGETVFNIGQVRRDDGPARVQLS